jgi:hypothetical protein
MIARAIAAAVLAAGLLGATAAPALASPGPGNSFQCAPGQHDGSGSNDSAVDHCPNQK